MSKLDKAKEKITRLRFWLGVMIAIVLSSIGWVVNNYNDTNVYFIVLGVILIFSSSFTAYKLDKQISEDIEKLEEL